MAFKTDLEAIILAALQDAPLHGYGIVRSIRAESEGLLKLGEGQLYPILHRMEDEGLVAGDWEMQDGKPPRKRYVLTDLGRQALEIHRTKWQEFSEAVTRVMSARARKEVPEGA
ncbi:MAG: helix-turn-helix transcriptional regulator [Methanoregulaceae archaeon]|jgi:DNA-binding PadR family transcriptional regulator|nr:helix-turn-helix transcriptional regulator [Methanoregulaceae archaeon]